MESEDNLNEYVKLRNIEGKVSIKKTQKQDNFEEESVKSIDENPIPVENITENEKLEIANLDVTTSTELETTVENDNESDKKTPKSDKETENKRKGILKYQRTYSNKHVDFNMDLEFVPFDESKDYTIEIQIVEQMPKKIVSYAALFAQQKKEEEDKLKKEAEEKEKQRRLRNKKRKYHQWKKILKPDKPINKEIQNNGPNSEVEHDISLSAENHLCSDEEMNSEKDDSNEIICHSDTDIEHSDSMSIESIIYEDDDNSFADQSKGTDFESPIDDLNKPLNDIEIETGTENNTDIETGTRNYTEIETGAENNTDIETGTRNDTENETGTENDTEIETGTRNDIEIETGTENDTEIETGTENDTEIETGTENDTETEIKPACPNEPTEDKCQNSCEVQGIDENFENYLITKNNSDNLQLFCVPAKKQRSNSLSDLDDFRKSHRFVVQRLIMSSIPRK